MHLHCLHQIYVSPSNDVYKIISDENLAALLRPSKKLYATDRGETLGFVLGPPLSAILLCPTVFFLRSRFLLLFGLETFFGRSFGSPGAFKYGAISRYGVCVI